MIRHYHARVSISAFHFCFRFHFHFHHISCFSICPTIIISKLAAELTVSHPPVHTLSHSVTSTLTLSPPAFNLYIITLIAEEFLLQCGPLVYICTLMMSKWILNVTWSIHLHVHHNSEYGVHCNRPLFVLSLMPSGC